MKAVVVKKFRDKNTKKVVPKGTVIEKISKERFDEINKAGAYLQVIEEEENQEAVEETADFSKMKVAELRKTAADRGIDGADEMKKEELVKLLEESK